MNNSKLLLYDYTAINGIEVIRTYASNRYPRWRDYALFHSTHAGIPEEANDVLNEVVVSLFSKDCNYLLKLFNTKHGKYSGNWIITSCEMIKLNCYSGTSPYRHKYKSLPKTSEAEWDRLKKIPDYSEDSEDTAAIILKQFRLVKWIFEGLDLTTTERKIFEHKFLHHNSLTNWQDHHKEAYSIFNTVLLAIHQILFLQGFTKVNLKKSTYVKSRKEEIVEQFLRTHKIQIKKHQNQNHVN